MLLDQPCKTSGERGRERREPSTPASTLNATHLFAQSPKTLKSRNPHTERKRGSSHHRHHRNPKTAPVSMAELTQLQQAQLATILGPDPAPFETLISHLMASSNEQRSQAELLFNLCKQTVPDSLSLKLAHLLQFSLAQEARAMSAILLRKQLTRDDTYLWPRLSPNTQSTLKISLCLLLHNRSCAVSNQIQILSRFGLQEFQVPPRGKTLQLETKVYCYELATMK